MPNMSSLRQPQPFADRRLQRLYGQIHFTLR